MCTVEADSWSERYLCDGSQTQSRLSVCVSGILLCQK